MSGGYDMFEQILDAVKGAAGTDLSAAPHKGRAESVVYRWFPLSDDGSLATARLELRFMSETLAAAVERLGRVKAAILSQGDSGVIGTGSRTLVVSQVAEGATSGYSRGRGLYFVKAGFLVRGRSDGYDA